MKQFLIISSFFLIIISFSMVGYHVVSANEKVEERKDQITYQIDQETYLSPYGYTLENPNIVLNPYGVSPLSAFILFETKEEEEVTITIPGKTTETTFTNTFQKTKKHIIPVYGLYPNIENKIEIKCGKTKRTYTIKTEEIPEVEIPANINTAETLLTIYQDTNYIYGIDKNKDIRWLYENNTSIEPYLLENNHLLVALSSNDHTNFHHLAEIDLTGKIYKQYYLEDGYHNLVTEVEDSLFVVSKDLIEMDKQTGTILNTYSLTNTYDKMILDKTKKTIHLINKEEELTINLNTQEQSLSLPSTTQTSNNLTIKPYTTTANYKILTGVKFQTQAETPQFKENIFLIGYKDPDKNYNQYNIEINQTIDHIQISGTFHTNDKVYIILDKFLDKRIYDLNNNYLTIHKQGLSGKYSIYIKINDTIYNTNTYVKF